jgi:hypothetical protein
MPLTDADAAAVKEADRRRDADADHREACSDRVGRVQFDRVEARIATEGAYLIAANDIDAVSAVELH